MVSASPTLLSAVVTFYITAHWQSHAYSVFPTTIARSALCKTPPYRSSFSLNESSENIHGEINSVLDRPTEQLINPLLNGDIGKGTIELVDVPPASFTIETKATGPAKSLVTTLTIHLGAKGHPEPLIIESGKIGRQASGAVTLSRGQTILYATASRDKDAKDNIDFAPLSVEHQERFSSAGLTSGSYNRRDGRPAEHEVLTCRLIDRPLRPMIHPRWRHETQILSWVLSYDGERSCDPLAVIASAAALWISDVPISKPVAAVMVGYIDGLFVINPTTKQMEKSRLNLTVAGTKDAVLMIEGSADFLPEDLMIDAVAFGHSTVKIICEALEAFGNVVGKPKHLESLIPIPEGLSAAVEAAIGPKIDDLYNIQGGKESFAAAMSKLSTEVNHSFGEIYPNNKSEVKEAFKDLLIRKMFVKAKMTGTRCDGRAFNEIRAIDIETGILPRVHGSALFTRGQTQALATVTLGDSGMKQKIDRLDGMEQKRFYLQYNFPPSSVGETGRVGAPGRREVGHGNLAERYLMHYLLLSTFTSANKPCLRLFAIFIEHF